MIFSYYQALIGELRLNILEIKQLEKRIENTVLIAQMNLEIKCGEAVAIQCNVEIGKQLIHILIGESSASGGQVLVTGKTFSSFKAICKKVGIVLLNESLYDRLTPFEYLSFYKRLYEVKTDVNVLLQKIGLVKRVRIDKLTFSEKKRLQIARAILHQPELIILEEPIQNIDIESQYIIRNLINDLIDEQKAILITTSNLENAITMTDHVYLLNEDGLKKIDVMDSEETTEIETGELQTDLPTNTEEIENVQESQINPIPFRFEKIPAKVNDKIILLDPTEIDYIESNDGISYLNVKGEVFPCSYSLNQLFDRLYPFGFFRCHRSYIVNLQKVREVITWTRNSYSLILDDSKKSSVPLSKGKMNELKEIIGI
jgi:ABC-2 type transport system ATP-binding protein